MEHVPQELVDKFIDELKDNNQSLRACSLVSRYWVSRSRRHLFQRIVFPTADRLAKYCDMFPTNHIVHSYVRGLAIIQWNRDPWIGRRALRCGLEHLQNFRALESLILAGITNGSARGFDAIEALADGLRVAAPSIKTLKLVHWKVSSTTLIEFICRFPSLDTLVVEDMDYLVGLPGWKRPSKFPPFAGHFEFSNSNGHGSAGKFLRHLSRLPLGFREISIDAGGAVDPVVAILEKCSPVLARASLYYVYPRGMVLVFLFRTVEKSVEPLTEFLGVPIREIKASFPELRELTLKPGLQYAGIIDGFALKLLSVISSPHLFRVTLDHSAPYSFGLADTNKWREADRTMFELTQRIGRRVSFNWYFAYAAEDVERTIRSLLERINSLGALRILEGGKALDMVTAIGDRWSGIVPEEVDWTNIPFGV